MSVASTWPRVEEHPSSTRALLRCDLADNYTDVAARWARLAATGAALAFQDATWLRNWYATLGATAHVTPLLVTLVDAETGLDVLGLPLVKRHGGGLCRLEGADEGLTDYNAPILAANIEHYRPAEIWRALRAALPPADLLQVNKMPRRIGDRDNPLAHLPGVRPSKFCSNILRMPEDYEAWHWGLERTFRKELERSLRVFLRAPGAQFRRIETAAEGQQVYAQLKRMQSARITELGLPYVLDEPLNEAFYDGLVRDGLADGSVVLTALLTQTEVVAALLGIRAASHFAMVRLAVAGNEWRKCSPGRLVIERTMKLLHAEGLRTFDFTIGDYAYKRRLGADSEPLFDLHVPLSWRGFVPVMRERLRANLRRNTMIADFRKRLRAA